MECEKRLLADFDTRIVNLIHDSMLLEIPAKADVVRAVGQYCYQVMTTAPKRMFNIDLPFKADYEVGKNWSDLVTFRLSDDAAAEDKQIEWENKDDTLTQISWEEWYNGR